jgi:hypothetical protein
MDVGGLSDPYVKLVLMQGYILDALGFSMNFDIVYNCRRKTSKEKEDLHKEVHAKPVL